MLYIMDNSCNRGTSFPNNTKYWRATPNLALTVALSSLVFGCLIYFLFRPTNLIFYKWIQPFVARNTIYNQDGFAIYRLPDWIIYNLPSSLWTFSFITLVLVIWNEKRNKIRTFWISIVLVIVISSELFQYFSLLPGTFDWLDVIFNLISFIFSLSLFRNV